MKWTSKDMLDLGVLVSGYARSDRGYMSFQGYVLARGGDLLGRHTAAGCQSKAIMEYGKLKEWSRVNTRKIGPTDWGRYTDEYYPIIFDAFKWVYKNNQAASRKVGYDLWKTVANRMNAVSTKNPPRWDGKSVPAWKQGHIRDFVRDHGDTLPAEAFREVQVGAGKSCFFDDSSTSPAEDKSLSGINKESYDAIVTLFNNGLLVLRGETK